VRPRLPAAGYRKPANPGLAQQPCREPAHSAGPEDDRVAAREPAGYVRLGEVEAGPGQRDAGGADRGLCAGPLARPQRRVNQAGDDGTGSPRLGGAPGRALDLGHDLLLADRHRVQPARDREQMLRGRAVDVDAGHPRDVARGQPPAGGQHAMLLPGRYGQFLEHLDGSVPVGQGDVHNRHGI
jgi:hypothetical protein